MSASRSSSSAEVRSPIAIPMLAATLTRVSFSVPSLNGCSSASSRRSAISSGPAASESSSEITTNSSPPSRPSASASRTTASSLAATARRSSSPTPWPSVSLTSLKLSRSMNSAATGVWLRRERAIICSTRSRIKVRFGRPVKASWVARNESSSSRRVSSSSVRWRSVSKHSHIRSRLNSRLSCRMLRASASASGEAIQLRGALLQHLGHHVAPPETAPGHLVQRRRAMNGQLAEDLPGFPPGLDRHLHALPRDPPGHRDRGAPADSFEAVLDDGVDVVIRARGSLDRQAAHILDSRLQRLAETTQIVVGLLDQTRRRRRYSQRIPSQAGSFSGHLEAVIGARCRLLEA